MDYQNWIKNELIPQLVEERKFSWSTKSNDDDVEPEQIIVDCQVNQITTADAFMLTKCFKIQLTLDNNKCDDDKQQKTFGIFVKISPSFEKLHVNFPILFQNEVYAYTKLFEFLEWTDYLPKYYYSHIKTTEESSMESIIVLDDFTMDGYKMYKHKGKFSLEHIYESVKLLGRFHGLSYAMKHTNPKKFMDIKNLFVEGKYKNDLRFGEPWDLFVSNGPKRLQNTLLEHRLEHDIPVEFIDKLLSQIGFPLDFERTVNLDQSEPLAIFSHGDFLRNNIAFKYCEYSDETPESVCLFDFQTIRYTSPMIDLVVLLSLSTSTDVRSKHFDYIFSSYHNEMLTTYCKKTGKLDNELPNFLSYESMLQEYGRKTPIGISIASFFLQMCLSKDGIDVEECYRLSIDEYLKLEWARGGECVNRELRALVYDCYKFYKKYNFKL